MAARQCSEKTDYDVTVKVDHKKLRQQVEAIFIAAGCERQEAADVAEHLVDANLVGHDSHGVIRVPSYIEWMGEQKVHPNRKLKVLSEDQGLIVADGDLGFGQVMAKRAMELAIGKSSERGMAVVALRNCGHVGRMGAWVEQAVAAQLIAICCANTTGFGILTAPFGATERRLSANPIAVGIPVADRNPIVLDIATCAVAEGKIRVALNRGKTLPDQALLDSEGRPTNDPKVFYSDPPGAILPFGGHKGYGLSVIIELLAGALTGGGCSRPGPDRLVQSMLILALDPRRLQPQDAMGNEIQQFIDYVKSARTTDPDGEILMPGEIECRTRAERIRNGIELDETTWSEIVDVCRKLEVPIVK